MKKLYIIYIGGTGGTFLNFFFNKFSKLTPDRKEYPFNEIGTVYNTPEDYQSPFCTNYHEFFIDQNLNKKNLNVCPITLNENTSYLYWTLSCCWRSGNPLCDQDNLWKKTKEECLGIERLCNDMNNLINNYPPLRQHKGTNFSKKEVRDWMLNRWRANKEDWALYQQQTNFENDPWFKKQNTHPFPIECYFNWDLFKKTITNLDTVFGLSLDFNREDEMQQLFKEYIKVDYCKQQVLHVKDILNAIKDNKIIEIIDLNVESEAYLISSLEKEFKKSIPSNESFFKSTEELIHILK